MNIETERLESLSKWQHLQTWNRILQALEKDEEVHDLDLINNISTLPTTLMGIPAKAYYFASPAKAKVKHLFTSTLITDKKEGPVLLVEWADGQREYAIFRDQ